MSDDPHSPTTAGPTPEPTPVVAPSQTDWKTPPGSAQPAPPPSGDVAQERPEILVGAAFAGGLVAAMILKKLTGGGRD